MFRGLVVALFCLMAAFGQSRLESPAVGFVHDDAGTLRAVLGIRGNLLSGDAVAEGILSAAFSGRMGLAKTSDEILMLDARGRILHRKAAPGAEAIFGFTEEGAPAAVFLTETGELYHWQRTEWRRVPLGPDEDGDEIIAVAGTRSGMISLVFHRDGACWLRKLSARSGRVRFESLLPGVSEPLLLLPGGALLYADGNRLVVRDARGTETRVEIPAPVAGLERMGEGWVHGLDPAGGAGMAIRVSGAGIELSQLPGVRP